jgi:hypothetical protein
MVRLSDSLSGEDNMNKYLMMSAAAALVSTAAQAGTAVHSWTFGTAGGGSYCDGGTLYTNGSSVWGWQHTNNDCAGGLSNGNGRTGKLNGFGKGADMSDNMPHDDGLVVNFLLPKKFNRHPKWQMDCSYNGTTAFQCGSGILIAGGARKGPSGKSTSSGLSSLIQLHRTASRS